MLGSRKHKKNIIKVKEKFINGSSKRKKAENVEKGKRKKEAVCTWVGSQLYVVVFPSASFSTLGMKH